MLTTKEKIWCQQLVRAVIGEKFKKVFPSSEELISSLSQFPPNSPLFSSFGSFVTLTIDEQLRGCIGTIEPRSELFKELPQNALHAAFSDPRFSPVNEEEYQKLVYEISILDHPKKVEDLDKIVVGTHGLIVQNGMHRGLLLPQVPVEWKWDRLQFIEQTCRKAGLPLNAWKDSNTQFYSFTAFVF